jgi:hypothetical protein
LNTPPNEPCHLGLEFITAAQDDGRRRRDTEEIGCPWGIASAEYGYCFWRYLHERSDADGRMEPVPDKEICALLGITQSTLERTLASALAKAKANKDRPEWQDFREGVLDRANLDQGDNTVYLPDNFKVEQPAEEVAEELPADLLPPEKKRRNNGLPMHRSGKRTDLFGIYSRKTLEKKRNEPK